MSKPKIPKLSDEMAVAADLCESHGLKRVAALLRAKDGAGAYEVRLAATQRNAGIAYVGNRAVGTVQDPQVNGDIVGGPDLMKARLNARYWLVAMRPELPSTEQKRLARLAKLVTRWPHGPMTITCPVCGAKPADRCVENGSEWGSTHSLRRSEARRGREGV